MPVMDVLITITVLDDECEELDSASASAETRYEAFELARSPLELEQGRSRASRGAAGKAILWFG